MSEEDFEAEALRRGFERKERPRGRNEGESANKEKSGCFDSCFGRGGMRRKDSRRSSLESVREDDAAAEFEFQPPTQQQDRETPLPSNVSTPLSTPTGVWTPPIVTPLETPLETPLDTPPMTPTTHSLLPVPSIYDTDR